MSKKSITDQEEARLWSEFASPQRNAEYDLHNPELLNALTAYAEGRIDDPGRERIERLLLESDMALDDLAFLREMEQTEQIDLPAEIQQRARGLIADTPQQRAESATSGWFGGLISGQLVVARGWAVGMMCAGMVCFSLVGFQLGMGTQQQQMVVDQLILSEFPVTLNSGSAMTTLGGGL